MVMQGRHGVAVQRGAQGYEKLRRRPGWMDHPVAPDHGPQGPGPAPPPRPERSLGGRIEYRCETPSLVSYCDTTSEVSREDETMRGTFANDVQMEPDSPLAAVCKAGRRA